MKSWSRRARVASVEQTSTFLRTWLCAPATAHSGPRTRRDRCASGTRCHKLAKGDRVVSHLFFSCGHCYYCRIGREQQCLELKGILGVLAPGLFAEHFKAPARNLFTVPEQISFDVGGKSAMDKLVITVSCDSTISYPRNPYNPKGVEPAAAEYMRSVNAGAAICHLRGPYTVDEKIQPDGTKLSDLDIPGWLRLNTLILERSSRLSSTG
jgi:hypothetical protein